MRDGRIVTDGAAAAFNRNSLVEAMGSVVRSDAAEPVQAKADGRDAPVVVEIPAGPDGGGLTVRRGEIAGLSGLGGHGQTELLIRLFAAAQGASNGATVAGPVALVAGDRQTDGIFPLWSIVKNISVSSLRSLVRSGLIQDGEERELAETWKAKIGIRTPDLGNPILSLSGGNQQKVLFARALASDAEIILMDDPMRGVDVGTKQEVYELLREEAARGRTFVWYTTETDELKHCDHVFVFRNRRIVADFPRAQVTEDRIVAASFADEAA